MVVKQQTYHMKNKSINTKCFRIVKNNLCNSKTNKIELTIQ